MKSLLEEFWYGNLTPVEMSIKATESIKELTNYLSIHRSNLTATLSEEQKLLLEKIDDCNNELSSINEREIFVSAFKLGARIAIEVMSMPQE